MTIRMSHKAIKTVNNNNLHNTRRVRGIYLDTVYHMFISALKHLLAISYTEGWDVFALLQMTRNFVSLTEP